jgi:hypothetical protein
MTARRLVLAALAALCAACATPAAAGAGEARGGDTSAAPLASGAVTVRGGETLSLRGATVHVDRVTYVNSPCPAGVVCIHSGIIKRVEVTVTHTGAPVTVGLLEGSRQVVDGVEVHLVSVSEGPTAVLEASLPLGPPPT